MPAVVSDTSPLIYLTRLGHLDWLRSIYGEIIIPNAVWEEIVLHGKGYPESAAVKEAVEQGWMRVQLPKTIPETAIALDPGESEAIALAKEMKALLIIDEMAGRIVARNLGLDMTGTAGVLLAGKLLNLTSSLKMELDRLQNETTFWLSDEIRANLLRQASENE